MPFDIKNKEKDIDKEPSSKLITDYLEKNQKPIKRSSSILSPPETDQQQKKKDTRTVNMLTSQMPSDNAVDQTNILDTSAVSTVTQDTIRDAIAPIINEIQLLGESVHSDYNKLHANYVELQESITSRSSEIAEKLNQKIEVNTEKIVR